MKIPDLKYIKQGEEILELAIAVGFASKAFVDSFANENNRNANTMIETAIELNKKLGDFLWIISLHNKENRKETK